MMNNQILITEMERNVWKSAEKCFGIERINIKYYSYIKKKTIIKKIGEYHSDIAQPGNVQSYDAFRPITRERKYFMDYNHQ